MYGWWQERGQHRAALQWSYATQRALKKPGLGFSCPLLGNRARTCFFLDQGPLMCVWNSSALVSPQGSTILNCLDPTGHTGTVLLYFQPNHRGFQVRLRSETCHQCHYSQKQVWQTGTNLSGWLLRYVVTRHHSWSVPCMLWLPRVSLLLALEGNMDPCVPSGFSLYGNIGILRSYTV